ncbi:MAG: hypothetical protein WBP41_17645 [Saprospiraceae bacterium]
MKKYNFVLILISVIIIGSILSCEEGLTKTQVEVWIQVNNQSLDTVYFFTNENTSLTMVRPNSQLTRRDFATEVDTEVKFYSTVYLKKIGSLLEFDASCQYDFLPYNDEPPMRDFIFIWDGTTLHQ